MFDKITNYLDAASNNIKVASAKMQRHSEEMVIRAEDSFFEEFGVSYEDHKAAQAQDKAILEAAAKHAKASAKAAKPEDWTFGILVLFAVGLGTAFLIAISA